MNQGFSGWSQQQAKKPWPYVNLQHQASSGTDAGGFTSGSFQTRPITTVAADTMGIVSLDTSTNRFTLPGGTYQALIRAVAFACDRHQARLQNITDGTTVKYGLNAYAGAPAIFGETFSEIADQFTISLPKVFEVQHRCQTTRAANGYGTANTFGNTEVYLIAEFWKIG